MTKKEVLIFFYCVTNLDKAARKCLMVGETRLLL